MSSSHPDSLLRRAAPAVVLAGAAGGLFVALDHPAGAVPDTVTAAAPAATTPVPTAGAATPTTRTASGAAPSTTTTPTTRSTSGAAATPTTRATTAAAGACTGQTVTGTSVNTRFGPVQVKATLDSTGVLCSVGTVTYPSNDNRSASINARAVPVLNAEAVAAKSASIAAVSGATITSNAYKSSLQSILDQR